MTLLNAWNNRLARPLLLGTLLVSLTTPLTGCRGIRSSNGTPTAVSDKAAAAHGTVADSPASFEITRPTQYPVQRTGYEPPTVPAALPPSAYARIPAGGDGYCPPEGVAESGPWAPDGLPRPWPIDEYIWDGGDRETLVQVGNDWTVRGLEQEDTVAHYDTLDGRVQVTPSNRVPIYAPRFAAVRQTLGPELNQSRQLVAAADRPMRLQSQDLRQLANTANQPTQIIRQHNLRAPVIMRDETRGLPVVMALLPHGISDRFLPYEDLAIIKRGVYDTSEKARLAELARAALTWSSDQSAQAVIDGVTAHLVQHKTLPHEALQYEMPPGQPRLRLCKVASKSEALPGETVDFTLRFDNVGDQKIGNVTIVDSLTTRLEYVPDSAQCSLPAKFGTQENDGESLVLRWEIEEPLETGKGGIIRFQCRVR